MINCCESRRVPRRGDRWLIRVFFTRVSMSVGEWVAPGNPCEKTQKTHPSHLLETPDLQHLNDEPKILHMHTLHLGSNKKINSNSCACSGGKI